MRTAIGSGRALAVDGVEPCLVSFQNLACKVLKMFEKE